MKRILLATIAATLLAFNIPAASTMYWAPGNVIGGAGTWNTAGAANWSTAANGSGTLANWVNANGDTASLGGGAGYSVTIGTGTANMISVNKILAVHTAGTVSTLNGSAGTLVFTGTGSGVDVATGVLLSFNAKFTGALTKTGAGRLDVQNNASMTGKWTLVGGTVSMPNVSRLGTATGNDFITFDGGGLGFATAATTLTSAQGITIKAGGAFLGESSAANVLTIQGPIVDGTAGAGSAGLSFFTGAPLTGAYVAGGATILANTTGTANSYKGPTSVANNCKLTLGAVNQIPDDSVLAIATGAVVDLAGKNETVKSLSSSGAGVIRLNGATLTMDNPAGESLGSANVNNDVTVGGKVVKNGSGVWTSQSGSSDYSGGFTLNNGTVYLAGNTAFGTGTLTINGGKIAAATGTARAPTVPVNLAANVTFGETGKGVITFGTGAWSIRGTAGTIRIITADTVSTVINSVIGQENTGNGLTLGSSSTGTLNLAGANTYTGPTAVNGGRLNVNSPGSLDAGSTVTVGSTATLGGTGTINGTVTVNPGGTLAPGTSIGTLTLGTPPSLGGTLAMEIKQTDLTSDKLVLTSGVFTYGGTLALTVTAGTLAGGEVFDLFDFTGTSSGSFTITTSPTLAAGLNWWQGDLAANGTLVLNRAPTALDKTYSRESGVTLKIFKSDLLIGATDPDSGDSVSFDTLVNSIGSEGATVTQDATTIFYEPAPGNNNSDTLTYRVKDARGGTSVTKNIQINVVAGTGQATSVVVSGSTATVGFAGIPGRSYEVQRSTTLVLPVWVTRITTNAPANGVFEYVDDFSDLGSPPASAYYRLRRP